MNKTLNVRPINLTLPDAEFERLFAAYLAVYSKEVGWVVANNVTHAPYHSTDHLIGVSFLLWYLCETTESLKSEKDNLVIAGLLHDFNYLGSHDDLENIVSTCRDAISFFNMFPKYESETICHYITYTYFSFEGKANPFISGGPVFGHIQTAMREADQLYGTFFFTPRIFDGLYQEIGVRFGQTREDFRARNIEFVTTRNYTYGSFLYLHQQRIVPCIKAHCKIFIE